MKPLVIEPGQRFGLLVVLEEAARHWDGRKWVRQFRCRCACGRTTLVRVADLVHGQTRSCGCLSRAPKHGGSGTRLYRIWKGMRQRCLNANRPEYSHYGGRGVGFCSAWGEFAAFREWALANGYRDDLSLDRIDNDGGYCPENCRWADRVTQNRNSRGNRRLIVDGIAGCVAEWAEWRQVNARTILSRLGRGLDGAEAVA